MVKRPAIVSQSPSMIRQWLDTVTSAWAIRRPVCGCSVPESHPGYVVAKEFMPGP